MAITHAVLVSNGQTGTQTSFTDTITPHNNMLNLCSIIMLRTDSVQPTLTSVTGNGLNWDIIATVNIDTVAATMYSAFLLRAMESSGVGTGTVTITGESNQTSWEFWEFDGVDTAGASDNGASSIVQVVKTADSQSGTDTGLTLAAFSNANNGAFVSSLWRDAGSTITFSMDAAGWLNETIETVSQVEQYAYWRADNQTDASGTLSSSTAYGAFAVEIKAAAAGGASPLGKVNSAITMASKLKGLVR